MFGVNEKTVCRWLRRYGIKVRTRSEALIENTIGLEHRDKISQAKKGIHCSPATEFTGENVLGEKNPFYGRKHTEETKTKISRAKEGVHVHSAEFKQRQSQITRKRWANPEYKKKQSEIQRRLWKDTEVRSKRIKATRKALFIRPTLPEQRVINLIQEYGLPFRYVGDGEVVVAGLNPDFIDIENKKIIEVFGRAFHDPEESFKDKIPWHQQYWGRLARYSQKGYDCLILWDDELRDEKLTIEKVRGFING